MFIPNPELPANKINTIQYLKQDIKSLRGTITAGSMVKVTEYGYGARGYSIQDLESGEIMVECGTDIFTNNPPKILGL